MDNNNRTGAKYLVRNRHSILGDVIDNYFVIDNTKPKKMILLKAVLNGLGVTGTGLLLYNNVLGWRGNFLWVLMGLFWLVQFIRACLKLYFEFKEGQIELEAKRARYKTRS